MWRLVLRAKSEEEEKKRESVFVFPFLLFPFFLEILGRLSGWR